MWKRIDPAAAVATGSRGTAWRSGSGWTLEAWPALNRPPPQSFWAGWAVTVVGPEMERSGCAVSRISKAEQTQQS